MTPQHPLPLIHDLRAAASTAAVCRTNQRRRPFCLHCRRHTAVWRTLPAGVAAVLLILLRVASQRTVAVRHSGGAFCRRDHRCGAAALLVSCRPSGMRLYLLCSLSHRPPAQESMRAGEREETTVLPRAQLLREWRHCFTEGPMQTLLSPQCLDAE